MTAYSEFLRAKKPLAQTYGFTIDPALIHPMLKPHQKAIVAWAVEGGRRAIFAAFGLGKSFMQLETLRLVLHRKGGRALIVCPLGVRLEFAKDARKLGIPLRFVRRTDQLDEDGIYITNYESVRDGKLAVDSFTAVSLDEASVLRSYGSKTYQEFLTMFAGIPFRYVATATPSPNRHKELIHYAGYLGIMDTGAALTRFFQRDSTKANNLTLYPHKTREFWLWLNTWAIFLQSPADLGFDPEGYDLPDLDVEWHEVLFNPGNTPTDRDGQGHLFRGVAMGLPDAAREKRESIADRVAEMVRILDGYPDLDQVIIWCDLNSEQAAVEHALKGRGITYSSIYGALDPDETERRLDQWEAGETVALIGKPVMLGQGMNFQQCNKSIYLGLTFKFNDFFQSLHRIHRFGQTRTCEVHLIHTDTEREVVQTLRAKWAEHEELSATMTEIIKQYGLARADIAAALERSLGVDRVEASGNGWLLAHNDCVPETQSMATDSVDLIVTSIPFSNHYEYTPSYNDFGHTDNNDHFWSQMDYLTPELFRVLAPGRIYACHVKDRILFGNVTGAGIPTVSPFHAEALYHGVKHGFDYMGMITVVTDVVRENNQTYRLGWTENSKDSTKMGVGSPEYILLFHKPQTDRSRGYADTPVTKDKAGYVCENHRYGDIEDIRGEQIECDPDKPCIDAYTRARWQVDAHAFWRSSGERMLTPDELAALPVEDRSRLFTEQTLRQVYDYESHIRIGEQLEAKGALPATFMSLAPGSWHKDVWHDVNRMRTLNGEQSHRAQALHVCPLQFDIVDRLIRRFSNDGDLVFDPFAGLGTVPMMALRMGRRGRGVELNPGYWADSVKYLEAEERAQHMPTLFDLDGAA